MLCFNTPDNRAVLCPLNEGQRIALARTDMATNEYTVYDGIRDYKAYRLQHGAAGVEVPDDCENFHLAVFYKEVFISGHPDMKNDVLRHNGFPRNSHDVSWEKNWEKLKAAISSNYNPNCRNNPQPDARLRVWVRNQYCKIKKNTLDDVRKERLALIGFYWSPDIADNTGTSYPHAPLNAIKWHLREIEWFETRYGHTNIGFKCKSPGDVDEPRYILLHAWTRTIRVRYHMNKEPLDNVVLLLSKRLDLTLRCVPAFVASLEGYYHAHLERHPERCVGHAEFPNFLKSNDHKVPPGSLPRELLSTGKHTPNWFHSMENLDGWVGMPILSILLDMLVQRILVCTQFCIDHF
jgi:hypothetical protein